MQEVMSVFGGDVGHEEEEDEATGGATVEVSDAPHRTLQPFVL